jgi:hypothetical protein
MGGKRTALGGFFKDADFDYEARIALGATTSGAGDVALVLAILDQITDGDPQSWFDAWTAMAGDLAARGDEALGRGHLATASWELRQLTHTQMLDWLADRLPARQAAGVSPARRSLGGSQA